MDYIILIFTLLMILVVTLVIGALRLASKKVRINDPFEPKTGIRKRVNGQWVTKWQDAKISTKDKKTEWSELRKVKSVNVKTGGEWVIEWSESK